MGDGYQNFEWADWIDTGLKLNSSYKFSDEIKVYGGLYAEERSTLGEDKKSFYKDTLSYKGKYRYVSGFLQGVFSMSPKLELHLNGRYDNFSFYEPVMWHHISPGIALKYRNLNKQIVSLSVNKGLRTGTINNHCRSGIFNSNVVYANPRLKPETFVSIEMNTYWQLAKSLNFSINTYFIKGDKMIALKNLESKLEGMEVYQYQNMYNSEIKGIEFEGNIDLSKIIELKMGYNYSNSRINDHNQNSTLSGNKLPYSPQSIINSGIIVKNDRISIVLMGLYKGGQYKDALNEEVIGRYITGDAKITYRAKNDKLRVSFSAYDIFNNSKMESVLITTPGIRFEANVTFNLL